MASSDEINLYITGSGGHAAMPDKNDDTILAMAQIILSLQHIINRKVDPLTPTVLSFGQIITNGAMNVFPEEVSVHGTFRTFDEAWRKKAHQLIRETAQNTANIFGVECNVVIDNGYPDLINDEKLTTETRQAAIEYLGAENVVELQARMTSEDFARYSHLLPSCFYRLGTGNQKNGIISGLHTPTFNIDEKSIETGTGLMVWIAISFLGNNH
jgi:amidohydrolase